MTKCGYYFEEVLTQKVEKSIETNTIDQSGGNKLVCEEETENIEHNNDRISTFAPNSRRV